MKGYLIPIIAVMVLAPGVMAGCSSVPSSEPTAGQESLSPESQQRISNLEQQIQLLTQEVSDLEKSISSLERKLETLPATIDADFEARIQQQITELGEQVDRLGEQLDELNVEVVTIKQQLAEQEAEEEATSSPSVPEAPSGTIFTFSGQGNSMSLPFTIGSSPCKVVLWSNLTTGSGSTSVNIQFVDPTQFDPALMPHPVGSYGFTIAGGISTHETIFYVPAGTYFLSVSTHYATIWTVWVVEL